MAASYVSLTLAAAELHTVFGIPKKCAALARLDYDQLPGPSGLGLDVAPAPAPE
ncbi:hypothetical protein DPMN_083738 [Dreissena polymorpha]|uniref:Uncharacterized protein n=1 Tax=Dreissena polymorpha TaxID=45954 RepID=A0A9D3Y9H1_DREPO|nr:hypothetical protein DPMN_083738 [Dreissena polymorpha]